MGPRRGGIQALAAGVAGIGPSRRMLSRGADVRRGRAAEGAQGRARMPGRRDLRGRVAQVWGGRRSPRGLRGVRSGEVQQNTVLGGRGRQREERAAADCWPEPAGAQVCRAGLGRREGEAERPALEGGRNEKPEKISGPSWQVSGFFGWSGAVRLPCCGACDPNKGMCVSKRGRKDRRDWTVYAGPPGGEGQSPKHRHVCEQKGQERATTFDHICGLLGDREKHKMDTWECWEEGLQRRLVGSGLHKRARKRAAFEQATARAQSRQSSGQTELQWK